MKYLLVGPLPRPVNGCSYANEVLLRKAAEKGVAFSWIDTSTSEISGNQGARFSLRKALGFLSTYKALPKVLSADVLYMTPGQTFFGLLKYAPFMALALLLGKPYVIHVHGNHLGAHYRSLAGVRRTLFHYFVSRASGGIVLSESLRRNFDGILPPKKVHVVENFAGHEVFTGATGEKHFDKVRILYLSNLMREKGIMELLDALLLLKGKGIPFEAIIAGQMESGVEAEVRAKLARLGESARYIGPISGSDKVERLRQANVFVLPTYYVMEGQPISLLEGLASGNIIVTTAHAGIPDVIDESNGFLVPTRDSAALAQAMSTVAMDLPGNLARFSAHNVDYAADRFTEQKFADKVLDVLASINRRGLVDAQSNRGLS